MTDPLRGDSDTRDADAAPGEFWQTACRRCETSMSVDLALPLPKDFPFCSERCRMIDLGRWFDEDFKVSAEICDADLDAE
jgi:endogenous inhibitor of DNA gyrase (YacG/DUF329 family)